jgi:hypothetical protein
MHATCPTHLILLDVIALVIFDKECKSCLIFSIFLPLPLPVLILPQSVRFQVLTAASRPMQMAVFWVVAPCTLVEVYRSFSGALIIALMMEAASTSVTSVNYQTTRRNNPEDGHLHIPSICVLRFRRGTKLHTQNTRLIQTFKQLLHYIDHYSTLLTIHNLYHINRPNHSQSLDT